MINLPAHRTACGLGFGIVLAMAMAGGIASVHWAPASAANIQSSVAPQAETQAITDAANAYLASLGEGQRHVTQHDFIPQKAGELVTFSRGGKQDHVIAGGANGGQGADFAGEKYGQAIWSNYPIGGVPRAGLQLGFMSVKQRAAAMNLLKVSLSPQGYQKVLDIMAGDREFASVGLPYAAGPDAYMMGIFGKPSATSPWMITFTGHHLGLNIVIAGAHATIAPTHTGSEPTRYIQNGHVVRVLAGENDKAFALLESFNADQRKQAVLGYELKDLVYGPGHDDQPVLPEGVKGSSLTPKQKEMLLSVISEWAGMINGAYGQDRMAEIRAGLDDTYFAWSGPTSREPGQNGAAYYRIQGPKVIIEFSPQTNDGDPRLHVHTIYRDPSNEYGHNFTM